MRWSSSQQFRLARFLPNGAPEPGFKISTGGFDPRPGVNAEAVSEAVTMSSDSIVVAGHANRALDLALAKYDDMGGLIKQVTLDFDANTEGYIVHKVAFDPAGQLLVMGSLQTFQSGAFVSQVFVLRLNADLTVDEQYGVQGHFVSTLTAAESVDSPLDMDLAVLADSACLVTTVTRDLSTGNDVFTVLRIDNQGRADLNFGTAGKVSDNLGAASNLARPTGLVVQDSGAIVVAGVVVDLAAFTTQFALVRFTADGRLDDTFGDAGRTITSFGPDRAATARALTLLPNGQLVVVGSVLDGDSIDFALARYSTPISAKRNAMTDFRPKLQFSCGKTRT